jgi:hypothetical protein
MKIEVHHYRAEDREAVQWLRAIFARLTKLAEEIKRMSAELDALKAEVQNAATVEQSAIALIQGLAAKIEANKTDPVALQQLADNLKASDDALAAAVQANSAAAQ